MVDKESLDYLTKTFPAKLSNAKHNWEEYKEKVMGKIRTYLITEDTLMFSRSQETLYIFGFPAEACMVSRVVMEDCLRRKYADNELNLKKLINKYVPETSRELAHKVRKNGNEFAHEAFKFEKKPFEDRVNAEEMAIESAKSLNQLLVDLGIKVPEY